MSREIQQNFNDEEYDPWTVIRCHQSAVADETGISLNVQYNVAAETTEAAEKTACIHFFYECLDRNLLLRGLHFVRDAKDEEE